MYEALHVADSPKRPIWASSSESVNEAYLYDYVVDYSSIYNDLIEKNYTYIVMSGEFDARDGAVSQYIWMQELLNIHVGFWEQDRQIYYYTADGKQQVGGYWVDNRAWNGSFALMAVPKAGHFIPYNNYDASVNVLNDLIGNGSVVCHQVDGNCSVVDTMCSYMQ